MSSKNEINPIQTVDDVSVLNEKYGIKSMIINGVLINDDGTPFTNFPIDFLIKKQELIDEYNGNLYQKKRLKQYPALNEQLDMLWHAMDEDASKRLEPFYTNIKTVKDSNPK